MFNTFKFAFALSAILVLSAGCGKQSVNVNGPKAQLSLKLHWIPDSHQLGFWTALDKGFYRQHGLEVTIYPGGMDANPIRDVINGSADLGQVGGIEQVVLAANEGLPVKAIAAIHRRSPHALISLQDRPIAKPTDFQGKTIAVAFGDTAEILLKAYLDKEGVPITSAKLVPFRYDLTPLLLGEVDAVTGFSTSQPLTIKEKGKKPHVLSYNDAGVKSYGYTIVASEKTIADKPDALKAFIAASREGWDYAFSHPEEASTLFKKRFADAVDVEKSKAELDLIKTLMVDEKGVLAGWEMSNDVVEGVKTMLIKYSGVKKDLPTSGIFNNSFVNE